MRSIAFFLILCSIVGFYVSTGYGHRNSAPNLECITCHEGEMVQNMVKIQGLPKSCIPGRTYNLKTVTCPKSETGIMRETASEVKDLLDSLKDIDGVRNVYLTYYSLPGSDEDPGEMVDLLF